MVSDLSQSFWFVGKLFFCRVTNAKLTATIKKITDRIVTLAEKLVAAAKPSGQRGRAPPGFDSDSNNTGSAANLDGVFMPAKKNKKDGRCLLANRSAAIAGSWRTIFPSSAPRILNAKLNLRRRP